MGLTDVDGHKTNTPTTARSPEAEASRWLPVFVVTGLAVLTFLVALAIAVQSRRTTGIIDADAYATFGFRIAEGRGLVDDRGNPTAFRGPVMPLMCAAIGALFGRSLEAVQVALCACYAIANGLVGAMAWRYYRSYWVVLLTMGMTMAFWPAYPWFCHIYTEPLFAAILALFLFVWTETMKAGSRRGYFATGMLLGVGALCRPEMYAFPPILVIDVLRKHGWQRKSAEALALLAVGFLLLEVPWVVRNYVSVGKPVITADNGTMNFYLATWYQEANWRGNPFHEPDRFPPAGQGFWQLSQAEQNRIFSEMAWRNIREAPLEVLLCIPKRFLMFFYQYGPRGWLPSARSLVFGTVLYLLAIVGFRRSSADQRLFLCRALCLVAVIALVHTAMVSEFRFSCPVQPYLMLMASVGLASVFEGKR